VLLRCVGVRCVWSPKGPRPGDWHPRWSGVSGCGLRSGWTFISAFVCGRARDSAFATGSRRERRDIGAGSPLSVDLQPQNGSCGCRFTDRTRRRRTVGQERRNEESCVIQRPRPDPETRSQPRARCRSRPLRRPPPANAEAAQRQVQTHCSSAPANPAPLRQPSSEVTTTASSTGGEPTAHPRRLPHRGDVPARDRRAQPSCSRAPARRASARTSSRSSPVTVTCPTLRPGFTPLP
jgi:hypothetical protein